jgi:gamma-glutamylcyclotransferase (GGCT)/AIG2-like uncharacterized protein YtfP
MTRDFSSGAESGNRDASAEPRHLFVYGTLMRASRSPYARLLQARALFVGEAWARGRLYNLGRFPGAVFDGSGLGKVHGELFLLRSAALLAALDAYEGCGGHGSKPDLFYRDIVEVQAPRAMKLAAWTYPFAGAVAGRPFIASGRYLP